MPAQRGIWMVAVVLYLVMVSGITWRLSRLRASAIERLDTPEARADWQAWRAEAARQAAGGGPVRRRVPASPEPPALVLLRDHYWACWGAMVSAASLAFSMVLWFVCKNLRLDRLG